MEDSNGFASYSGEPTPTPTPTPIGAFATLAPTPEDSYSTPWPTHDRGDQGYYDDGDMTPLMRAYATIGFIIRIFLPIILIIMCCRLKRRGEYADGLGGAGSGGRAQDGFVSGETRMDPEERKRYVEERLCSKKVIQASQGQAVPSFADDAEKKGDIIIPKEQTAASADNDEEQQSVEGEEKSNVWFESEEPSCSICLCPFEPAEEICWSSNKRCKHSFHKNCMSEWLQRHSDCPQCRQDYLKTDGEFDDDHDDEEKEDDVGDNLGVAGSTTITFARNSTSGTSSRIPRPLGGGGSRSRSSGGHLEDVDLDLERGDHNSAPTAADLELPEWYTETIPGNQYIGLRYSASVSPTRRSS